MKKHLLLISMILAISLIAGIRIEAVYYHPFDAQNSEYILLYNTGEEDRDISGYRIATSFSETDVTIQGIIRARSVFLIADSGWSEKRDNMSWPLADHEQTMTMSIHHGWASIRTPENEPLSTVGWRTAAQFEGEAHPGVQQGKALVRINDTNNNSNDFIESNPIFSPYQQTTTNTPVYIIMEESIPKILHIQDTPDEIQVSIKHNNTLEDIRVFANGEELLTTNNTKIQGAYTGAIDLTETEIEIRVESREHVLIQQYTREPIQKVAIAIPEDITIQVQPRASAYTTIQVKNTGTVPVNLHIGGTIPLWANKVIGNITYELAGQTYSLTETIRVHELGLVAGEELEITLRVDAGAYPARTYPGNLHILGVSQ